MALTTRYQCSVLVQKSLEASLPAPYQANVRMHLTLDIQIKSRYAEPFSDQQNDLRCLRVCLGAEIVVAVGVVAPPRREGDGRAASAEDGEGEDEEGREAGAVESAGDEVRVVLEDAGAVVAEIVLDEETRDDPAENDAGLGLIVRDISCVLDKLGHVDLVEREASDLGNELNGTTLCQQVENAKTRRNASDGAVITAQV